jgi:hypothetical protein
MFNMRPIDDPNLQAALDEVKLVMARHGLAGACMLVAAEEGAFTYNLVTDWSAFRRDDAAPMGFRLRANSRAEGKKETERRIEGAAHTVCQLSDFGSQTQDWMEQLKAIMRQAGIDFEHRPFNGAPLPSIGVQRL